jgi:CheY-like chemotaxis protein
MQAKSVCSFQPMAGLKMSDPDNLQKSPLVVMVADADPHIRELAGYFLTEAGYSVTFEIGGYEALDSARKAPPMAILADLLLDRLDGLALCRLLKGDPATEHIAIIVFSVLAAEERARNSGADAFMLKPLEKNRLLMALEEATRKRNTIT